MYNFLFCGKMGKICWHGRIWTQMGFKCLYGRIWHICFALMTLYTLDKYHCELLGLKVVSRRKLIVWDKQTVAPVATQISRTAVLAFRIISQMLILLSLWTYETYYRNCFINYCFPYYYLWLLSCELPIAAVHIPTILPWMHVVLKCGDERKSYNWLSWRVQYSSSLSECIYLLAIEGIH